MTWRQVDEEPELDYSDWTDDYNEPRLIDHPEGHQPPYGKGDIIRENNTEGKNRKWVVWDCRYDTQDGDWFMACVPHPDHPDFERWKQAYEESHNTQWVYQYEYPNSHHNRRYGRVGSVFTDARDLLAAGVPTTRAEADAFFEKLMEKIRERAA